MLDETLVKAQEALMASWKLGDQLGERKANAILSEVWDPICQCLGEKAWPKIYWLLMLAEVYSLRGVPHLAPNRQTVDVAVDSISNNCRGS